MARLIFYVLSRRVCVLPSLAHHCMVTQHASTAKTHTFAVGRCILRPTYKQIVVRTSVYCIDGHEFRSSISSNHKFTFNAFLSTTAAVSSSSSKHHQFPFLRIAWLCRSHQSPTNANHKTFFSLITNNQKKPTNTHAFLFAPARITIIQYCFACAYFDCAVVTLWPRNCYKIKTSSQTHTHSHGSQKNTNVMITTFCDCSFNIAFSCVIYVRNFIRMWNVGS